MNRSSHILWLMVKFEKGFWKYLRIYCDFSVFILLRKSWPTTNEDRDEKKAMFIVSSPIWRCFAATLYFLCIEYISTHILFLFEFYHQSHYLNTSADIYIQTSNPYPHCFLYCTIIFMIALFNPFYRDCTIGHGAYTRQCSTRSNCWYKKYLFIVVFDTWKRVQQWILLTTFAKSILDWVCQGFAIFLVLNQNESNSFKRCVIVILLIIRISSRKFK